MNGVAPSWLAMVSLLTAAAWVTRNGRRWSDTTLVAPKRWLLMTLLTMASYHALVLLTSLEFVAQHALRLTVACLTFSPVMAVLGAKRPQQRGWQFVVLVLWGALSQPALEAWAFGQQNHLQLHAVRQAFLLVLGLVGVANYVATRFGVSMVLYAAGQYVWLSPFTKLGLPNSPQTSWGSLLIATAVLLVAMGRPRRRLNTTGWNRVWIDFRDAYGAAWGMRCLERWNAAARKFAWGTKLEWAGFDDTNVVSPDDGAPQRSFRMLMRRFVSAKWIRDRIDESS